MMQTGTDAGDALARSTAIAAARAAIGRGDLVEAYDLARQAHELAPGSDAAYPQVLALARMGDIDAAMTLYARLGLDADSSTDSRTLAARLQKDRAFASAGAEFEMRIAAAARAYAAIFAATHDPFPGINAASLSMIAGDVVAGRADAEAVLARLPMVDGDFYAAATRAEALLLLGDSAAGAAALATGLGLPGADAGALATTRRQFERLAAHAGLDSDGTVRALLALPAVAVWCGHMFREDAGHEAAIAAAVRNAVLARRIGIGFGAIAAGSDIVIAETFLEMGLEIHIVLPFSLPEFLALSVEPVGGNWRHRAAAVLARAQTLRIASIVPDIGDPLALSHGSRVAMGLARLRARHLGTEVCQIAVWDHAAARGVAGTAVDVAAWRADGRETIIVAPGAIDRAFDRSGGKPVYAGPERQTRAIIFGDVVGFSKLREPDLPGFWAEVMGRIGARLAAYGDAVIAANSWGDALFAVVVDTPTAAGLAIDLQQELGSLTLAGGFAALRVGAHFGTVYHQCDPITGRPNVYGSEVNRAARIEPITPPGAVYVTEAFAAALAMDAPDDFDCFYVGQVPTAKDYGTFPMYRLTRR